MTYFILVCVLLSGFSLTNASPNCSPDELEKCVVPTYKLTEMPATKEDLDKMCSNYLPFFKCTSEFVERCPESDFSKDADDTKERDDMLNALCTEGSIRTKYIANMKCISNAHEIDDCVEKLNPDFEDGTYSCQYEYAIYGCFLEIVSKECGTDDAVDVVRFLSKPVLNITKQKCCQDKQD